jgi:hypothetical protein
MAGMPTPGIVIDIKLSADSHEKIRSAVEGRKQENIKARNGRK